MRLSFMLCKKFMVEQVAKEFLTYGSYSPTPMSLSRLLQFGRSPSALKSFEFLRHEVPVRLANIMHEIHLLPEMLLSMPSTQTVIGLYRQSFQEMLEFKDESKPVSDSRLNDFTEALAQVLERHRDVVETMAHGVVEMREQTRIEGQLEQQLQYFLDRFYMSRISIRMLINQHVLLFGPELRDNHRQIGSIDPHCDIMAVLDHAFTNARFLCEQFYLTSPPMTTELIGIDRHFEFAYVPSHLYHMLFEILKNSMRALVERDEENMPPIHVLVCAGEEDLTIKVSDRGGGIPRSVVPLVFKYTYSTAKPVSESASTGPPLAGYGYGLPLSRIYARYFHGDLKLSSVDGYGTDAYICMKKRSAEASELLPVFNQTSAKQYTSTQPIPDWSSPAFHSELIV